MIPTLVLLPGQSAEASLVETLDGGRPRWSTAFEAGWVGSRLVVRFTCEDDSIWCTMTERDMPLWDEEVVEVFLAPGSDDPKVYFEFEVNPDGVLWDGRILCPSGNRSGMVSGADWDCPDLEWSAWRDDEQGRWGAELSIPLTALVDGGVIPREWRFNAYRIERPMDGEPEYSAWSPTGRPGPEFHRPSRFGKIILDGLGG